MGKAQAPAWRSLPVVAWVLVLTGVILVPLVRPGYALLRDMVFTPRQTWTDDAWGAGPAVPRAVPVDALVAALTTVVDGAVVQRVSLVAALVLAGLGAARLVPGGRLASCGAATLMVWNPYVAERLLMGHWSLLLGYAALPWLVSALLRLRAGDARAGWQVAAWTGLAAVTPGGGLVCLLVLVPMLLWPGGLHRAVHSLGLLGAWGVLNAPWWLAGLLHPSGGLSDPEAVMVFAARSDTSLGVLGSLLGLGGVWNGDAVPVSRAAWPAAAWTVVLLVAAVAGFPVLRRAWGASADALLAAGLLGVVLASWATWGESSLVWVVENVPGGGLLRDGQRLVAPWALVLAVCVPLGARRLGEAIDNRVGALAVTAAVAVAPVVVMPDLAAGGWGQVTPVQYPAAWDEVADAVEGGQDVAVVSLPWQPLRRFAWNEERPVLDPAPRYLPAPVATSSDLTVRTPAGLVTISGEDPRALAIGQALGSGGAAVDVLPPLGVGWVLVSDDNPAPLSAEGLDGATLVVDGNGLSLYRLPRPDDATLLGRQPYAPWLAAAWAAAVGLLGTCVAMSVVTGRRAATIAGQSNELGRNGT